MLALEFVEGDDYLAIREGHHVDDVIPYLLVENSSLARGSKSCSIPTRGKLSFNLPEEHIHVGEVILCQLRSKKAGDPLLLDKAVDLAYSHINERLSMPDQVEQVAEVCRELSTHSSAGCRINIQA